MPRELLIWFLLKYTAMPFSRYVVAKIMNVPSYYAAGLILVSCCPRGTYLERGNVALSVLMTTAGTFASMVLTPYLTSQLAGQYEAVDRAGLFLSAIRVVRAPLFTGTVLNR